MKPEGKHILLVEDNPADVRLMVEILADASAGKVELQHVDRISAALKRLGERISPCIMPSESETKPFFYRECKDTL
jgi:CheY-like chemotaxis protein